MPEEKNKEKIKIAILGGDLRQIAAARRLKALGYTVSLYGFDTYGEENDAPLEEAVTDAAVLLFPVPVIRNDRLNLPFSQERLTLPELFTRLDAQPLSVRYAFGGILPETLTAFLAARGIPVCDLCQEERFNIRNSIPTAEGAIAIAMNHMDITLNGCSAAVLGFGRIGKTLCRSLHALGAKVTAVSRNSKDQALSEIYGYRACSYATLPHEAPEFDVIFNTVPSTVVTEDLLAHMKKEAFVIDLASKPGGVDSTAALRYGIRVISALSLPGKVAPVTAGHIIADCLVDRLQEEVSS